MSAAVGIRSAMGAAAAAGLAVLAGVTLADRRALEAGEATVAVFTFDRVAGSLPGRSGTLLPRTPATRPGVAADPRGRGFASRLAEPDAAPPPGAASVRSPAPRAARAPAAERRTIVGRLAAVLDGFVTGLDRKAERDLAAAIYDASRAHGIDPFLTLAVIQTESGFQNRAISVLGARGLMQIRPFVGEALAAELEIGWDGESTLHDPVANVHMGVYYLARLRARFGDMALALAAYNIGPNAVQALIDEERQVPTGYVRKVLAYYGRLLSAHRLPEADPAVAARAARLGRAAGVLTR